MEDNMQNVERLSITLPVEMARMIRDRVEAGRYASNSEVIREAMRVWQEKEQLHAEKLASIRAKVEAAETDPRPSLGVSDVEKHFEERLKQSLTTPSGNA
jgi:antitoxin ParD1/3/4